MNEQKLQTLIFLVLVAILGGVAWYIWGDIRPVALEPAPGRPGPVLEQAPAPREPIHPIEAPEISEASGELVPLPDLDESDSYFLLALADIFGADIGRLLVDEALIDKFVATVDNLTRSHVSEKIRPVGTLSGEFIADGAGTKGPYFLSPDNYDRYEFLVGLVASADLDVVTAMYRRFYPLFQKSYERLGYPDAYFNDRVIEVIDHLLETPEAETPTRLVRPHVLYEFEDSDLESLSSGQKLLIRVGAEHAAYIKRALRGLRSRIT